ncbi:MAG: SdpI family protein [Patescibacteria group bacterium]|nr:SdpI family protein [Patescibacteria group bacterium]
MPYPIKVSWKTEILPLAMVIAALSLGAYFYPRFPETVVTHWNIQGEPNGYMGRLGGAFVIPGLLAVMYLLFLVLPALDPKSERYAEFGKVYQILKNGILATLLAIYAAAGFYNLGYPVKINAIVPWLVGLLLIVIGNYMGKLKRNWFVGVRTPWTLSSENAWNKTNRASGYLMMLFGLAVIVTPYLPKAWGLWVFIGAAALMLLGSLIYSYVVYRRERRANNGVIVRQ